jgi:hypothetical protein
MYIISYLPEIISLIIEYSDPRTTYPLNKLWKELTYCKLDKEKQLLYCIRENYYDTFKLLINDKTLDLNKDYSYMFDCYMDMCLFRCNIKIVELLCVYNRVKMLNIFLENKNVISFVPYQSDISEECFNVFMNKKIEIPKKVKELYSDSIEIYWKF